MAVYYSEFDTTMATIIRDLRTAILSNPDWTFQGYATALCSSTAIANSGATSMTFTSGTIPSAIVVGSRIRIDTYESGMYEYRDVTSVSATTIGFAGLTYGHAVGTPIYWGSEVFKSTTVRGAPMVFDLTGGALPAMHRLGLACYGDYTAPNGTTAGVVTNGSVAKYLYWRNSTGSGSQPVHVVLSSSKDHIFLSVEGPRGSEAGTDNGVFGSPRNYFFMADLVPYSVSDVTPVVVSGGAIADTNTSSTAYKNYVVSLSKNLENTQNWVEGKLLSLNFPSPYSGESIGAQRFTTADDEFYLSPFVVSADDCGFRGRLNNFYYAGYNVADNPDGVYSMIGSQVDYNSVTYELKAVTKSNAAQINWGPFGATANNSATAYWRSPIVAIPVA